MATNSRKLFSRSSSRRNSTKSEPDEYYDAKEVLATDKLGSILNNTNAAIMVALDKEATEEEIEQARKDAKLTAGPNAIRKTMRWVEENNKEQFDKRFGQKISEFQTHLIYDDKIPNISLPTDKPTNYELNNIIKRQNNIYEGKLDFKHPYLFNYFKHIQKEQERYELNKDDMQEILRNKLTPEFYEILDADIEQNGFESAWANFCNLFVNKPVTTSKRKDFHQFELNFNDLENSLKCLQMAAIRAYPKKSQSEIDEMMFHYFSSKLKEPLLGAVLSEQRRREQQRADGFPVCLLIGKELLDFILHSFRQIQSNRRFLRNSNNDRDIADLRYEMKALRNRTSSAIKNVETKQYPEQPKSPTPPRHQRAQSNENQRNSANFTKIMIEPGSPHYKEAVGHLYKQYPLNEHDLVYYIRKMTIDSHDHFKKKIKERDVIKNYKPQVQWKGNRYITDEPEFKGELYKTIGNRSYLTWQTLEFFSKRCLACGLFNCFDPYGKHCPARSLEPTWSICNFCLRGFHKTRSCLAILPEKN